MTNGQSDSTETADDTYGAVYSCDNCRSLLDLSTWTPTETDDEGSVYRFCDDDCRGEWD